MLVADQFFCQQSFSLVPHKSRVGDFSHVQLIKVAYEHDLATFVFTIIFAFALLNHFLMVFHIHDNLPSVIPLRMALKNYCDCMQTVTVQETNLDSSSEC
jgi:hypothetical protein